MRIITNVNSNVPALLESPQVMGSLLMTPDGEISINAGRAWYDPNTGKSYINFGQEVTEVETNATLTKDQWIAYDRAVRMVAVKRLAGIQDLMQNGLVYQAGDLGITIAEWDAISDMTDASINMEGVTPAESDNQEFALSGVPVPIIRKDFNINSRRLLASRRNGGTGLDTTGAQTATRLVIERSERMLFNGANIKVGGYPIYGYTNHPQRVQGSLQVDWAASGTTGKQIMEDVIAMISAAEAVYHRGPYMLYIPQGFSNKMKTDYSDNKGDNTIGERIEALAQIQRVRVSDELAEDNVVLVEMSPEVVDLAVCQDITTLNWSSGDGMRSFYSVLAAWAPRIKPDYNDNLGIVHYTWTST